MRPAKVVTLLFLTAACASAPDLPMRTVDRLPAVDVTIGGHAATFIVDVDANVIAVSPSLASRLGLTPFGEGPDRMVTLPRLIIGSHELRDVPAIVDPFLDRVQHDGVLGTPAYENSLLTLDYPGAKVRIEPGRLAAAENVFACSGELPQRCAIPITLAGEPRIAVIDTAAQRSMLIPRDVAARLELTDRRPGGVAIGPQTGAAAVEDAVLQGAVVFGSHQIDDPAVTIHDRPRILIGSGLLSRFVVTFDLKNRLVRIQ